MGLRFQQQHQVLKLLVQIQFSNLRCIQPVFTAKVEPEEKARTPKSGDPARNPAPTRSTCRDNGKSVAGLRNCEKRKRTSLNQ
jgi:hypothetical protein